MNDIAIGLISWRNFVSRNLLYSLDLRFAFFLTAALFGRGRCGLPYVSIMPWRILSLFASTCSMTENRYEKTFLLLMRLQWLPTSEPVSMFVCASNKFLVADDVDLGPFLSTKTPHPLSLPSCWARGTLERSAAYVGIDTFIASNDFLRLFFEESDYLRGVPRAEFKNEVGATYVPGPGVAAVL